MIDHAQDHAHAYAHVQAWLDPLRLPSTDMLTCKASGKPLDFLLQVGGWWSWWGMVGDGEGGWGMAARVEDCRAGRMVGRLVGRLRACEERNWVLGGRWATPKPAPAAEACCCQPRVKEHWSMISLTMRLPAINAVRTGTKQVPHATGRTSYSVPGPGAGFCRRCTRLWTPTRMRASIARCSFLSVQR